MFLDNGGGRECENDESQSFNDQTDQIQTYLKISQEIQVNWNLSPGFDIFLKIMGPDPNVSLYAFV